MARYSDAVNSRTAETRHVTPLQGYVLHHTHWDREWWAPFQAMRVRLVETIDALLDAIDADDQFRCFLLDGQMVVLEDYLEVRPDQRERLCRHIRAGRIECGPWYILPDEFLVSGESHVRNLLLGKRVGRRLDVPLLAIGYIPDTFGHVAQMPQILRGFGIDSAFLWRGRGGDAATAKSEFLWEAPDGSTVLTHWFPDGYYQMPFLHFDDPSRPWEDRLGRIHATLERLGTRATTDAILLPYGGDHRPVDRHLPDKIRRANDEVAGKGVLRWATIGEYLAAVRERGPQLQTVCGELRETGPDSPHLLAGVLSSRLDLKQRNALGELWLHRRAEPLMALAALRGCPPDAGLLWKAWELLIQNHPHDSICGCSIDEVHRDMVTRFAGSRQLAEILSDEGARWINARIGTDRLPAGSRPIVVHNSLPRERSGWATVWVEREAIDPRTHSLLDSAGTEVGFTSRPVEGMRPMSDRYRWTEIGFRAEAVPGMGYSTFALQPRATALDPNLRLFHAVQAVAELKGSIAVTDLALGANTLENRHLRVEVDPRDGTLTLTERETGLVYRGLNAFEDGGDAGDTYTYAAPLNDTVLRSDRSARVHVSVTEAGHARATLRVDVDWVLPSSLSDDRLSRSSRYVETRLSTFISLEAGERRVDIRTEWENHSRDHRLRVLLPLGAQPARSHAEGQFAVTDRPVVRGEGGNGWPELPASTLPQGGWVSVDDGERGLTIANRGLPEYEVLDDGRGTVALTLLRAVGWLSRDDTLSRVGGAGPEVAVPDAQLLEPLVASYAVIPHGGNWLESGAYRRAEEYAAPLYGSVTDRHPGDLPLDGGVMTLTGDHTLVSSAFKPAEDGRAVILRCWNAAPHATEARLLLEGPHGEVRHANLAEEPLPGEPLPLDRSGAAIVRAGPAEIVTLRIALDG